VFSFQSSEDILFPEVKRPKMSDWNGGDFQKDGGKENMA
jgi:hypothetical protein